MIGTGDEDLLPLAGAIPQLVSFAVVFGGEVGLSNLRVVAPQESIGQGELRVDLNGALENGNTGGLTREVNLPGHAIGLHGFERRSSSLGERSLVFFHRGERFAHPVSE